LKIDSVFRARSPASYGWRKAFLSGLAGIAMAMQGAHAQARNPLTDPPPPGYYTFQKVVYQNDGGWPDDHSYFERLLRNINAHLVATDGKVELRVVNFAAGVKMFQMARTDATLSTQIDALRAKGVTFEICRNTLRGMGIGLDQLYNVKPDDVVPSGVAEIARLQGLGYVFEHP
jgi:intracellular sulfur oxidation DsrE/DsrF family protein